MIRIYKNRKEIQSALEDEIELKNTEELSNIVKNIIESVKTQGDEAVRKYSKEFSDLAPEEFELSKKDIELAISRIPTIARQTLEKSSENIKSFAHAIKAQLQPITLSQGELQVGLDYEPVEKVGCYVPGGKYPLPSTALMTAITAQVAGVPNIYMVSPKLCDETIYAGLISGVQRFYQVGGAQAIAALAFGTETIERVDVITGPGNAYVTEAKRQLQGIVGIDMLAGPSEIVIIADKNADPNWIALDILAQLEHGPDSKAVLLTDNLELGEEICQEIEQVITIQKWFPQEYVENIKILILESLEECIEVANQLAPEHLELQTKTPQDIKPKLKHYGALFMGYNTTVALGDYMAGPNHTLPTGRTARFSGGLTPLSFLRPQSWVKISSKATETLAYTRQFACIEGLTLHSMSVEARL